MKDRKMNGLIPQPERVINYTSSITLTDEQYDRCTSSSWFIDIDGVVYLKTEEELEAELEVSSKEVERLVNKGIRDEALSSITVEVNGKSIQARPSDELNLRLKIQSLSPSETTKWTLSNNKRGLVTREELEAVYAKGLALGAEIYDTYNDTLEDG